MIDLDKYRRPSININLIILAGTHYFVKRVCTQSLYSKIADFEELQ